MPQTSTLIDAVSADLASPTTCEVVAVVLTWYGRLALLKRSRDVTHDVGRWHCVTGFVDPWNSPLAQAAVELWEETGLRTADLQELRPGPVLHLADDAAGSERTWTVHTFVATTQQRRLTLNAENDSYRWVTPAKVARFDGQVSWLGDVLRATGFAPVARAARS